MDFSKRVWVEVNLDNLEKNINNIKDWVNGSKIIAVIKANAYGHGAIELASFYENLGLDFLAVSNSREALELRRAKINSKILILGYTDPSEADFLADNNISQSVFSYDYAKKLSDTLKSSKKKLNIHIKLNTGMNRLGFDTINGGKIDDIVNTLDLDCLDFEGIFTHFAAADGDGDPDGNYTKTQFDSFNTACKKLEEKGYYPKIRHCCNSAATLSKPEFHLDALRPGIILYGLKPDRNFSIPFPLFPAMSFKAVVTEINTLAKGNYASYGLTYKADKNIKTATICVGYADGYPRALSNKGEVLIGSRRCKILGRVCMDQLIVDISELENVSVGDEVVLFGKQGNEEISIDEVAQKCDTINYEIICGISRRVPRYYKKQGKTVFLTDYLLEEF